MPDAPENSTHPATRAEWRAWLEQNHTRPNGVWLISYKKAAGKTTVTYGESVEEALCFGWIDSKGNKLDDERTMLWFAPRKPRTGWWSRPNKERIARLTAAGLMADAGQAKIDAAQQDGSWSPLDAVEAHEIPPDLAAALATYESAQTEWGRPLVDSTLTLALVTGLSVGDVSQYAVNLGWDEVRLPAPLFDGDTVYAQSEVLSARESRSRPQQGLVTLRTIGYKQDGTVVIEFKRTILVYKCAHLPQLPVPRPLTTDH